MNFKSLLLTKSKVPSDPSLTCSIISCFLEEFCSSDLSLSKIGEPYLKSSDKKSGLGLGLFIGKTLLEKNFATVNCWNSQTRSGAEVTIKWKNKDLFNL